MSVCAYRDVEEICWHTEAETKWLPYCGRYFQLWHWFDSKIHGSTQKKPGSIKKNARFDTKMPRNYFLTLFKRFVLKNPYINQNKLPLSKRCDSGPRWPGQGWGLLSWFPPFRYFPIFSQLSKHTLAVEYHVYIWQVSPQLSCGDTCQISMWFKESNRYFFKIEIFAYGEISERSFSNLHPWVSEIIQK